MKRILILLLIGIIGIPLSSSIPIKVSSTVWYSQYVFMLGLFFLAISVALWKFNRYLSMFTLVCLFSVLCITGQSITSIIYLIHIDLCCLAIYFISRLNERHRRIALKAVVAIVIIQGIWVCVQYLNIDPIFDIIGDSKKVDDTVGFSGSHNQIGAFFAITAPAVFYVFPYIIFLTIFGLFNSTTMIACLAFVIVSVLFYFRSKAIYLVVPLLICSGIIYFNKFETDGLSNYRSRLQPLEVAIQSVNDGEILLSRQVSETVEERKTIRCNPIFGFGLANFQKIFPYYKSDDIIFNTEHSGLYTHLHNDIGENFFELGYLGFLIILLIMVDLLIKFKRAEKTKELITYSLCLLAYVICSCAIFTSYVAASGMWLVIFLGLFYGVIGEQDGKKGEIRLAPVLA